MRLTLILVFTTLGIVAKANPKPDLLTVKAQVAVKVKLGSTVFQPHDLSSKTLGKHSSRENDIQCMSAAYWSTTEEQIVGEVGPEGDRVYSYCARTNSSAGPPPYTSAGPGNWITGNYVRASVKNPKSRKAKLNINVVKTDKCIRNSTECSCKSLLDRVISSFRSVAKIELQFSANPKEAGCRCYLGNAARYGFKSVELKKCPKKDRVIKFDENNFVAQSKIIVARDCAYNSDWLIHKKKECVSCAK